MTTHARIYVSAFVLTYHIMRALGKKAGCAGCGSVKGSVYAEGLRHWVCWTSMVEDGEKQFNLKLLDLQKKVHFVYHRMIFG